MSKPYENTLLNDLAPLNNHIELMTAIVAVNGVYHSETKRNAIQIKVGSSFLVNDHLFQHLAVNLGAVGIDFGSIVHLLYVVADSVKLFLVRRTDILTFRNFREGILTTSNAKAVAAISTLPPLA